MSLRLQPLDTPRRGGPLPPVAVLLVAGVVAANAWWMWHAAPERAPVTAVDRLEAMHAAATAVQAVEDATPRPAAPVDPDAPSPPVERSVGELRGEPVAPTPGPMSRSVVLRRGETLYSALDRLYVPAHVAETVVAAFSRQRDPRTLQPGERIWAEFASRSPIDGGGLVRLVVGAEGNATTTVRRAEDTQRWLAEAGGAAGIRVRQVLRCGLRDSLSASIQRCGHGEALTRRIVKVLRERIRPERALRSGDELRVVFDAWFDGGEIIRYGRVAALRYTGATANMTAVYFDPAHAAAADAAAAKATTRSQRGADATAAGRVAARRSTTLTSGTRSGYYDLDGSSLESVIDVEPIEGARLTSRFDRQRLHPILRKVRPHLGIDYAAPTGTPIFAAGDGRVVVARKGRRAGRHVKIQHDHSLRTEYMHLSRIARGVRRGKRVAKGDVIGYVGSTGLSTGPHLHFGLLRGGFHIDPLQTELPRRAGVAERDRARFEAERDRLVGLLDAVTSAGPQGT